MTSVLFLGGSGVISSACSDLAVRSGLDLTVLNRGRGTARPLPEGTRRLRADVHDRASVEAALGDEEYDAVVHWVAFDAEDVEAALDLFRGRTRQLVLISSASAYETPPRRLPVTEATPLRNPFWEYSRRKIACEDVLVRAYRDEGFPMTIVRPSHTYDRTMIPLHGGWTMLERMRQGKEVVVHGDGASLWTLTHHEDFARGFVPLLGNPQTIGRAVHITSDEALTWDAITWTLADALGVEPRIVHVPSDVVASVDEGWGASLLGDKAHSMVFDNSLVKSLVPGFAATIPFARGAREIVEWYDADASRRQVDPALDRVVDDLVARCRP
ncbi:MAG TPA: SDR family oxidoreductase [Marmoricola sp.]|nr:SDR family oxidoreductase [Marmoricola sp.]